MQHVVYSAGISLLLGTEQDRAGTRMRHVTDKQAQREKAEKNGCAMLAIIFAMIGARLFALVLP